MASHPLPHYPEILLKRTPSTESLADMRTRLQLSTFLLLLASLVAASPEATAAPPRPDDSHPPNLVLLFADDLGYGDLSSFNSQTIRTPNIDRLGVEGTRFTSFYVAQAVCTASRAGLLTGCYPNRVGLQGALNHTSNVGIAPSETLLPELCKSRGYATAIYGKWHLGHRPPFLPTRNGFDHFVGIPYSNDNGPLHPVIRDIPPLPVYENEQVIAENPDQSLFTRTFTEKAVAFIEQNKNRPFFLYVPHVMPHVPIFASEAFKGQSPHGLYADVVEELDWSVGQILDTLDRLNLSQNTLVIFLSDNGPFLSYGTHAGSAAPLREGKLTTFEGGVRSPCLMRWPGRIPAGRTCDVPLMTIDLLPSWAAEISAPLPDHPIDGRDIRPILFEASQTPLALTKPTSSTPRRTPGRP